MAAALILGCKISAYAHCMHADPGSSSSNGTVIK